MRPALPHVPLAGIANAAGFSHWAKVGPPCRINGDTRDQVGPLPGGVAVGNVAGAACNRYGQHAPGARRPDAARLPAAEDLRKRPRGKHALTGAKWELVNPVGGDGVADICGLLPRSQARHSAIWGCVPSPPPMLLSLMECDHMYSVPQSRPRATRRCRETCSALKLLLPNAVLLVHATEIRQRAYLGDRIEVVDVCARRNLAG